MSSKKMELKQMEPMQIFSEQVSLLISLLPQVAKQPCFALKGGTAINLFVRDMPRLSVDIDLTYLPLSDRDSSLAAIDKALRAIAADIERVVPGCKVQAVPLKGTVYVIKLLILRGTTAVKVEVSPVLRGSVHAPQVLEVKPQVRKDFSYARMQVLAFEDLYAGKLCAALDRQHPRDLFDVRMLLINEGITPALKDVFLVYLLSHNRPIVELLDPVMQDIADLFQKEFLNMAAEDVPLEALLDTRMQLVSTLRNLLTEEDKRFLLTVKRGEANWSVFWFPAAEQLPSVQWKLHNLAKMSQQKRREAADKLESVLFS
jgi:hypothetical protein